jgi:hypothetical protein
MRIWKFISTTSRELVLRLKNWRRQTALSQAEAERLDRIRNPSKYLGK